MAPLTPLEQQQLEVAPSATFWHRVRFDLVARHLAGRRTVLDVGAGSGLLGDHLRRSPITYRCADASPALRTALAARFGEDALDDGGPIDAATTVTLLDVLEHDADDAGVLRELAGRMAPGSGLIVTVPAMSWLFSSWDVELGHHRRYTRRGLAELVETCGFEIVEAGYLFPELVLPALLRKLRPTSGGAEFPDLPAAIDRIAGAAGRLTSAGRTWMPVGTSAVVVARRTGVVG